MQTLTKLCILKRARERRTEGNVRLEKRTLTTCLAPQLGNRRWNEGQSKVRWRGKRPSCTDHSALFLLPQCPLSARAMEASDKKQTSTPKKKNQKPMRTRLPRDSGETKGGLQRRRLAGWREETFLFQVPWPLRNCSAASSFRPRPPSTNHHHNTMGRATACPPASPPRNQTRPGVGRSKR